MPSSWRRLARRPVSALLVVALVLTASSGLLSCAYRAVGLVDDHAEQPCREVARGPHPCNVCGEEDRGSIAAPFPYKVSDAEQPTTVIRIETAGQFGNNLFQYAAALVTVAEHEEQQQQSGNNNRTTPVLRLDRAYTHGGWLPRMRELAVEPEEEDRGWALPWRQWSIFRRTDPQTSPVQSFWEMTGTNDENAPYFQHQTWIRRFLKYRQHLCHYLAMPLQRQIARQRPGPDDAVVAIRKYAGKSRQQKDHSLYMESGRLVIPPYAYFAQALDEHTRQTRGRDSTVWIVCYKPLRSHPIVRRLVRERGAVLYRGGSDRNPLVDFQFLSFARHVVMTPSTFYWWAVFLGQSDATVHVPLYPAPSQWHWCEMMVSPTATGTVRYRDWFRNVTLENRTAAYEQCRHFETHPAPRDDIAPFYKDNLSD